MPSLINLTTIFTFTPLTFIHFLHHHLTSPPSVSTSPFSVAGVRMELTCSSTLHATLNKLYVNKHPTGRPYSVTLCGPVLIQKARPSPARTVCAALNITMCQQALIFTASPHQHPTNSSPQSALSHSLTNTTLQTTPVSFQQVVSPGTLEQDPRKVYWKQVTAA